MKLILVFFFALLTPFFIFITQLLYTNTDASALKKELADTNIYRDLSSFLMNVQPEEQQDTTSAEISTLIYERFTPTYIQTKTEKLIDDSHSWITKDGPKPVLSFTDIKSDLVDSYPEFRAQLEYLASNEMKQQIEQEYSAEGSFDESAGNPDAQRDADSLTTLAQNDFTVPIGDYFQRLKQFYDVIKIVQPVLAAVLIGILLLLLKGNDSWNGRFQWIGAAVITAALFGFGMILFNTVAVSSLSNATMSSSDNFIAAFSPIILQMMDIIMKLYGETQKTVSIILMILGIVFLIAARFSKAVK